MVRRRYGMKVGGRHNWNYRTRSDYSRGNTISLYQTKKRNRPAPRRSGMPVGSKLHWGIKGTETVRKVRGGWLVTLKGIKTQKGFTLNKYSKYIRPKRSKGYGRMRRRR